MSKLKDIFKDKMGMSQREATELYETLEDRYGDSLQTVEDTLSGPVVRFGLNMISEIDDTSVKDLENNQAVQDFAAKYGIDTEAAARITIFMQENGNMLGYDVDSIEKAVNACNNILYSAENGSFQSFGIDLKIQEQTTELKQDDVPQTGNANESQGTLINWFDSIKDKFDEAKADLMEYAASIKAQFCDKTSSWLSRFQQARSEEGETEEKKAAVLINRAQDSFDKMSHEMEDRVIHINNKILDRECYSYLSADVDAADRSVDPLDSFRKVAASRIEGINLRREETNTEIHKRFEETRDAAKEYLFLMKDGLVYQNEESYGEFWEKTFDGIANFAHNLNDKVEAALPDGVKSAILYAMDFKPTLEHHADILLGRVHEITSPTLDEIDASDFGPETRRSFNFKEFLSDLDPRPYFENDDTKETFISKIRDDMESDADTDEVNEL